MSDVQELLKKAVFAAGSQAAVAVRIGYSPATLSMVLKGTYPGDMGSLGEKVNEIYGGKTMQEIPEGYMQNAIGHLVPIESIKEIDIERDEFVRDVIEDARAVSVELQRFKTQVAEDMQAFVELSAEKYGANLGGSKGNISLLSYDGAYKVTRDIANRIDFDERLNAAKELIDECLREWSKNSGPELRTLVDDAFQVDKKGRLNVKRIISLRKFNIAHPTWRRAMEAIGDAITVTGSCTYYRVYERDEAGNYNQIALDFSGV
ncbi:MAG: DUF3164 family protein [Kiritimatiellia bacterium]